MKIVRRGAGPSLVLLHGAPSPARYFDPIIEAFASRFTVLMPRLPGYDAQPLTPTRIEDVQRALDEALAQMGITEAAVLGYSLGAYRAIHWALRPSRLKVRGVYLLSGFAGFDPEVIAAFVGLAAAFRTPGFDPGSAWRGRVFPARFAAENPALAAEVDGWIDEVPATTLAAEFEALANAPDLRPEVSRLNVPLVARNGLEDVAAPAESGRQAVAGAPSGRFEGVPGCGHGLLLEDREATLHSIGAWLDALPPSELE